MHQEMTLRCAGLHTDPNEIDPAMPHGAMTRADNIQIRRRGAAEIRPSFPSQQQLLSNEYVDAIIPFEGSYTVLSSDTAPHTGWYKSDGAEIVDADAASAEYVIGETSWAEMQRRLYVTLEDQLARYNDVGDTTFDRAGVAQPGQTVPTPVQSEDLGWLGLGDMVAYRVVVAKTIGDQLLLSAPSSPSYVSPTTDWITDEDEENLFFVELFGRYPPDIVEGDEIQIYRTPVAEAENRPSTPGDEMRLLGAFTVGAAPGTTWAYTDLTPDEQLVGAALYTNQTQQGILNANVRPPRMGCVTTYADMMFGGNTKGSEAASLGMTGVPASGEFDFTDPKTFWPGLRVSEDDIVVSYLAAGLTVTLTGGGTDSLDFQNNGSLSDVGNGFWEAGTNFDQDTRITNVNVVPGTITLTLNKNPLADGTEFTYWTPGIKQVVVNRSTAAAGATSTVLQDSPGEFNFLTDLGGVPAYQGVYFDAGTQITGWDQAPNKGGPDVSFNLALLNGLVTYQQVEYWKIDFVADYGVGPYTVIDIDSAGPNPANEIHITGPGAEYGYSVGQEITDWDAAPQSAGATWPAGTEIISINRVATDDVTLTVSENALQDDHRFAVWDWIAIDGTRRYGAEKPLFDVYAPNGNLFLYDRSYLWCLQAYGGENTYRAVFNQIGIQAVGGGPNPRALLYEASSQSTATFTITSSKPLAFAEDVDATTGVTSESETNYNRLVWSKTQEPDGWPLPYFVDIGSASARILRVLPTRESLFVFKEDGTWRVTGFSPTSLRVDEYDRTLRLMHPNAVSQVDNNLFGWFVGGVSVVTDAQTANISDNFIGEELGAIREVPAGSLTTPWTRDIWAFTVERDDQWHLITGDGTGGPAGLMYVFNLTTQAWVTWTMTQGIKLCSGIDLNYTPSIELGGQLGDGGFEAVVLDEEDGSSTCLVDGTENLVNNVSGVYEGTVAKTDADTFGRWRLTHDPVPVTGGVKRGDAFFPTGNLMIVEEVISATECICIGGEDADFGPEDDVEFIVSIVASMEWTAKTAQNPGKRKHWREANFPFRQLTNIPILDCYFSSDINTDVPLPITALDIFVERPHFLRTLLPRDVARGTWLNPRIDIPSVFSAWQLDGCNLVYEWMNERTGR